MSRNWIVGSLLLGAALGLASACGNSAHTGPGATAAAGSSAGGASTGGAASCTTCGGGTVAPNAGASGMTSGTVGGTGTMMTGQGGGSAGAPACTTCNDGRLTLHDNWTLQSSSKVGTSKGDAISAPGFATAGWYPISVPSTVLAGLVANNVYPDPYAGDNLSKIPSTLADGSWWYRTEFTPPADFTGQALSLALDGINFRANVWLNGKQIATSDKTLGTFTNYVWDVKLNPGAPNALAVEVMAPDLTKDLALTWLDWNPAPADRDMGIWHDVYLRKSGAVSVRNTHVSSKVSAALDSADLTIKADVTNTSSAAAHATLNASIDTIAVSQVVDLAAGETKTVTFTPATSPALTVKSPRLWWPAQFGTQELYELSLTATVNGMASDHEGVQFGIRDVSSSLTPDGYRLFKINGKPILIRGGGWASDMMLRLSAEQLDAQFQYVRDMGLNTIRLEGKMESEEFYAAADHYGILLIPGWMCCDHWQEWDKWSAVDHQVAVASVRTQARRMRNHPSVIDFLIGSDEAPSAAVEKEMLAAFAAEDWPNPIGASAAKRIGLVLGASGMKMPGPYDWVAPSYWMTDTKAGGGFGFNSEAGPGPAVPEIESVKAMLTPDQQTSLWTKLNDEQFHAGTNGAGYSFGQLKLFNEGLSKRLGAPTSLEDYVRKAQIMDYEAERAPFEAYGRNKYKNATGYIHWMLNNAWPSLIWHLYGSDLAPAASYFGAKTGNEPLHVLYSYDDSSVVVLNHTLKAVTGLAVTASVYNLDATQKWTASQMVDVPADGTAKATTVPTLSGLSGAYFVMLTLKQGDTLVSSNVYLLSAKGEKVNLDATDWYHSPTSTFADYSALSTLPQMSLQATLSSASAGSTQVTLSNKSTAIAYFTRLKLTAGKGGKAIAPVLWQDNYVTLLPGETRTLNVTYAASDMGSAVPVVEISGWNQPLQVVGG